MPRRRSMTQAITKLAAKGGPGVAAAMRSAAKACRRRPHPNAASLCSGVLLHPLPGVFLKADPAPACFPSLRAQYTEQECIDNAPNYCEFRTIPTTFWWAIVTMTTVSFAARPLELPSSKNSPRLPEWFYLPP